MEKKKSRVGWVLAGVAAVSFGGLMFYVISTSSPWWCREISS